MRVPVLALVENMSHFVGDKGRVYRPLGRGHTDELMRTFGIQKRVQLPMHPAVAGSCDGGGASDSHVSESNPTRDAVQPWEQYAAREHPEPFVLWGTTAGEKEGLSSLPTAGAPTRASIALSRGSQMQKQDKVQDSRNVNSGGTVESEYIS